MRNSLNAHLLHRYRSRQSESPQVHPLVRLRPLGRMGKWTAAVPKAMAPRSTLPETRPEIDVWKLSTMHLPQIQALVSAAWLSLRGTEPISQSLAMDLILKRARAIEIAVLEEFDGTTAAYKSKIRTLFVNLKDKSNPSLREGVVSGHIPVERFCRMTSQVCATFWCNFLGLTSNLLGNGVRREKSRRQQNKGGEPVQLLGRRRSAGWDWDFPMRAMQASTFLTWLWQFEGSNL